MCTKMSPWVGKAMDLEACTCRGTIAVPLSAVAEHVVWQVIKAELAEKKRSKAEAKKRRARGLL